MKFSKLFKGLFIFLLLLVVAAIAIPYFFKDQIVERVKSDINKNLNATVDFKDVSLSLFRSFPDFSFGMDNFTLTGKTPFEGLEMANIETMDLNLNLMSVINTSDPIQINSISLVKPKIHLLVQKNGKSNYDIAIPSDDPVETSEGEYSFLIQLQEYAIEQGHVIYDDRLGDVYLELKNLNHSGKGDFTQDIFDLVTKTNIDEMTARSGGIAYLNKVKSDMDITFKADLPNNKYTLKENEIKLNALTLRTDGSVQLDGDAVNMDLTFDTPGGDFKHFLSLIPNAYTKDFEQIKTDGKLKFNGAVKGSLAENSMPTFKVNLDINDASFKYPDLPMGISKINTSVAINSPTSNLDNMIVDVSDFAFLIGSNPMSGFLKLKSPISDPDIDSKIEGTLNFADLSKAFPMEGVSSLSGILKANIKAKTRLSTIEKEQYDQVDMNGILQFNKINYKGDGMPLVLIEELAMNFSPQKVVVNKFVSKLGESDIRASATIDNVLALISPEKTMTGQIVVQSNYFNANEWLTEAPASSTPAPPPSEEDAEVFDQFDLLVDAKFRNIDYDVYKLQGTELQGRVSPNHIKIENAETNIGGSDLKGNGELNNVFAYLYNNEILTGDLSLKSKHFDLNQFMVEEGAGTVQAKKISETPSSGVILIPENVNVNLNASMREVVYTDITLKNLNGNIAVKDEEASINNCVANLLGGSMKMNGSYNTSEKGKPLFDMDYAIRQFNFQESFKYLNTFKAFAPIGEYIEGNYNTTLKLQGTLGEDMFPIMNAMTADGFLETINGSLKKFPPLEKVSSLLNISSLKSFNIKDTKNWFEVLDGRIVMKEFDYSHQGIDMVMNGSHGLEQDMDYTILAKIPREMWSNNAAGKAAGKGIDYLKGEAGKLGVNLDVGDFVDVQIKLLGSITSPKIQIKPLGSGGKSLKETAKDVVDDVVNKAKDEVTAKVEEKKEVVTKKVDDEKEKMKKKADAEIKKIMDIARKNSNKIKREAKNLADRTRKEGYKQADELIKKAGKNPIKKMAAKKSAEILRKQTDKKADRIVKEGNKRADQVMKKADDQALKIKKKYGVL